MATWTFTPNDSSPLLRLSVAAVSCLFARSVARAPFTSFSSKKRLLSAVAIKDENDVEKEESYSVRLVLSIEKKSIGLN